MNLPSGKPTRFQTETKEKNMIDNLTNDITRLCGEITALRDSRAVLRTNLAQGREDREGTVSQMLADFRNTRKDVAERTQTELRNFVGTVKDAVTELKQGVAVFQEEFLGDLAGARRKLANDLRYLRKRNLSMELMLLLRTVPKVWDQASL